MNQRSTSWQESPTKNGGESNMTIQRAISSNIGRNHSFRKSPTLKKKSSSIGSDWTITLTRLRFAGSYFEAVECLRETRDMLSMIDRKDRLKFCKSDYDGAIEELRKQQKIWSIELFKESVEITLQFFDVNPFNRLPLILLQELLLWLPVQEFVQYACISSDWKNIVASNLIWNALYVSKFLCSNPGTLPLELTRQSCYMDAFRDRAADPHLGDKVEVSWKGKFRLETQDVYQGVAWWVAEVVDKHRSQGRYKIHYPGWESRWDEWVPRSRLRWSVQPNTLVTIFAGDIVELWCCGQNVPGAWLECKVKKIRGRRYCLGKVLSSGYLWVDRERLRLVRRDHVTSHGTGNSKESSPSKLARTLSSRIPSPNRQLSVLLSPLATLSGSFLRGSISSVSPILPEHVEGEEPANAAHHLLMQEQGHTLHPVSEGAVQGQCIIM